MKYVVVLCDGMADYPVPALGGKTPMMVAKKPHIDALAAKAGISRSHLSAIEAPDKVYESFRDPLAASLAHEEYVTSLINAIYAEAMKANDFRTLQFLDWFVKEQGEEEKNANDLLGRFDLFASDVKGLYALDAEMAARTYTAPSLTL